MKKNNCFFVVNVRWKVVYSSFTRRVYHSVVVLLFVSRHLARYSGMDDESNALFAMLYVKRPKLAQSHD